MQQFNEQPAIAIWFQYRVQMLSKLYDNYWNKVIDDEMMENVSFITAQCRQCSVEIRENRERQRTLIYTLFKPFKTSASFILFIFQYPLSKSSM